MAQVLAGVSWQRPLRLQCTLFPVPTYIIEALPDLKLKELSAGYESGEQETKTVTITRKGTAKLSQLSVSFGGTDGDKYFAVTQPVETTLENTGDTTTFKVTTKAGLSAGTYTAMVIVAADNMTPVSFSVTQVVNAASPAKLSSLRVSRGILTPAFSPDISNYAVNVGNGVTSINLTADLADPKSSMTINGKPFSSDIASTVDLNVGTNPIRIELTAADGVTKSFYTISVKRNDYIPPYYPVTSVALSKSKVTLTEGGATETLTASVLPDYATNMQVTWRSSNPMVAKVDQNGVVTPLAEGTAIITVTTADQEKSAECQVTVLPKDPLVTGINVSEKNVVLKPKQSLQLQVMIVYADRETKDITTDENTKYSSSLGKIATVEEGRIIAGKREGTATITIGYLDETIEIPVTVSKFKVQELTTPTESVQMELKENMQLRVMAHLSNGKRRDVISSAIWSSDNEKSVTVSRKGKVAAVGEGTATITAIYGSKSVTIDVEVFGQKVKKLTANEKKVVLEKGNEQQIELTAVFLDGSEKSIAEEAEWSTTNEKIAIVKNGLITAVSAGRATIKAKYRGKTMTFSVTVTR